MFLVGLTGGIATGKSTVSRFFSDMGVEVVDADIIAREVVAPGKRAWKKIKLEFGDGVLEEASGEIDRTKLGNIIFNDREKRHKLDAITHPEVYRKIFWMVIRCFFKGQQFVILDLPLLYESGFMLDYMHKIIVVTCDEEQQLSRLVARTGLSESDARKRIQAQMPLNTKCERANLVIDNCNSLEDTRRQTELVLKYLRRSKQHWWIRVVIGSLVFVIGAALVWLGTTIWFGG